MMESAEKYCMKWSSYEKHIGSFLSGLCESEILADVTLWAENQKFNCHRIILSACSPYFQEILSNAVSKHPVIVLAGMKPDDIKTIIHFIYHGELDNISYDQFISVLKAAELLKIYGLTEVIEHIPPRKCLQNLEEIIMMSDNTLNDSMEQMQEVKFSKNSEEIEQRKQKPKKHQRKYSEGSLGWALSDMEKGMPLVEAARLHKIPRSTLYAKAKQHSGLRIASRKEHTNQDCQAAVQAVAGGLSLKRASEQYGIPKTVLWRRVQKRLDICSNLKSRRKQERNLKLEENDKNSLTNQNLKLNINDRVSLASSHTNKIKTVDIANDASNKGTKQYRLAQALNACKEGKMSQGVASRTFQVPKTLIWRRLQKAWSINQNENIISTSCVNNSSSDQIKEETDIKYISVISNVNNGYGVTLTNEESKAKEEKYLKNNEQFTETPLIILTSSNEDPKEEVVNDDELIESLNVSIENVVEVVSDKGDDIHWS